MTASTTTALAGNGSFNLACCPPAERMKIEAQKHGYLILHKLKGMTGPARQARGRELMDLVPETVRPAVAEWLKARAGK
jgi:hypothetical protein